MNDVPPADRWLSPAAARALLAGPDVSRVAPALLGCWLQAGPVTVRLTEVEAYAGVGQDPGSHAHRGRTPRTAPMFGPPGFGYVYLSYGLHWCLNVVTGPPGQAAAVLLRAGAVLAGAPTASQRRPGAREQDLCRGPARLTKALGIDRSSNAVDLLGADAPVRLLLAAAAAPTDLVRSGPRVGVGGAGAGTPWRFFLAGESSVSPYRLAAPRRRSPP